MKCKPAILPFVMFLRAACETPRNRHPPAPTSMLPHRPASYIGVFLPLAHPLVTPAMHPARLPCEPLPAPPTKRPCPERPAPKQALDLAVFARPDAAPAVVRPRTRRRRRRRRSRRVDAAARAEGAAEEIECFEDNAREDNCVQSQEESLGSIVEGKREPVKAPETTRVEKAEPVQTNGKLKPDPDAVSSERPASELQPQKTEPHTVASAKLAQEPPAHKLQTGAVPAGCAEVAPRTSPHTACPKSEPAKHESQIMDSVPAPPSSQHAQNDTTQASANMATPSSQPQQQAFDPTVIAAAMNRHRALISGIDAALSKWRPTMRVGHAACETDGAGKCSAATKLADGADDVTGEALEDGVAGGDGITVDGDEVLDPYQKAAIDAARAGENFFLTGSAGTGKSFVLKRIIKELRGDGKSVAVTASTGCAAVAINGNTIHSVAGVGVGLDPPETLRSKATFDKAIRKRLREPDVLVIDEVSMIDSFLFDKIEIMFSTARKNMSDIKSIDWNRKSRRASQHGEAEEEEKLFGGIQVIACGDFFQLPPVKAADPRFVKSNEKFFAFESATWRKLIKKTIVLRVVHRQSNRHFVGLLKEIRYGIVSQYTGQVLDACRIDAKCDNVEMRENGDPVPFTKLFSYRRQVANENYTRLQKLVNYPGVKFFAKDFIDVKNLGSLTRAAAHALLQQVGGLEVVELKERCRVLCLKNVDKHMGIVNGSAGYITGFRLATQDRDRIEQAENWYYGQSREEREGQYEKMAIDGLTKREKVSLTDPKMVEKFKDAARDPSTGYLSMEGAHPQIVPVVRFDNGVEMSMEPQTWDVYGMQGQIIASRRQIPLSLGWALSIHKAQGMTIENVQTDLDKAFDFGQVYVALSRATSAHGLRLTSFDARKVTTHRKVIQFYEQVEEESYGLDAVTL